MQQHQMKRKRFTILLLQLAVIDLSVALWPFSSSNGGGTAAICDQNNNLGFVCDCTEPNVVCNEFELSDISTYVLPDNAGIVDFSRNQISSLPSNGIEWPASVTEIHLTRNLIQNIGPDVFRNCSGLETLDLSRNKLMTLKVDIFHGLSSLNSLDLSYNNLQKVNSQWFTLLPNLIRISLAYNPLGTTKYKYIPYLKVLECASFF
jgi:hypothetical protein